MDDIVFPVSVRLSKIGLCCTCLQCKTFAFCVQKWLHILKKWSCSHQECQAFSLVRISASSEFLHTTSWKALWSTCFLLEFIHYGNNFVPIPFQWHFCLYCYMIITSCRPSFIQINISKLSSVSESKCRDVSHSSFNIYA